MCGDGDAEWLENFRESIMTGDDLLVHMINR